MNKNRNWIALLACALVWTGCGGGEDTVEGPSISSDTATDSGELDSSLSDGETPDGAVAGTDATAPDVLLVPDVVDDVEGPDVLNEVQDDIIEEVEEDIVEPVDVVEDIAEEIEEDIAEEIAEDVIDDVEDDADTGPKPDCVTDLECSVKVTLAACLLAKCKDSKCVVELAPNDDVCDDGDNCTDDDKCNLGQCVGGKNVCGCKADSECGDNNDCTADTCDPVKGKCDNKPAAGGPCDDGDDCTQASTCQADGKCSGGKPAKCDDSNPCTDDSCAKDVGCVNNANTKPCEAGNCLQGGTCKDSKCAGGKEIACDDKNPCTDDKCDPTTGKCASSPNSAKCDDGAKCTDDDKCVKGKCGGTAKVCDDKDPCTADACDKATGDCTTKPTDGACDDGNKCTGKDACKDGKCAGSDLKDCTDDNPCTDDNCDKDKGCVHPPNTAKCADAATCKSGLCKGGKCQLGDKVGCDDNNPCTADTCDKDKGCVYAPVKDDGKCDDGNKCTKGDNCKDGKCTGASAADCDDDNPCTTDACDPKGGCSWSANKDACEDGNKCTKDDKCKAGKCQAGTKIDPKVACDDNNQCTKDTCAPAKGCVNTGSDGECDDDNPCTKGDVCKGGKCAGATSVCPDGGQCKVAKCDTKTGDCSWGAKNGACDDGNKCTTDDACKNGKCAPTLTKDCDDKNGCTKDSCDAKSGKCGHVPTSDPCDDGNGCTSNDACVGGKCAGANKDCADGDPCTADSCDAKSGKCINVKDDKCKGCKVAADCDDKNACTDEICNGITGKCSYTNNTKPCDNNDPCTYGDKCDGKGKCVTGKANACDDGNPCTVDSCDKGNGKCVNKPAADGGKCDDGKACTTGDACAAGKCKPKDDKCDLLFETFDCPWNNQAKGWTLQGGNGNNAVSWRIDDVPKNGMKDKGCSLNYNDDKDYCQAGWGNSCQTPNHSAYTPIFDASKANGTPRLSFWTFYQVDGGTATNTDRPRVRVYRGNQTIYNIYMDKSKQGVWRKIDVPIPNIKGYNNIRIRFYLSPASGQGGNTGKGWYIDDLRVTGSGPPPEVCDNGKDDDGDKKIDCADSDCKGAPICQEVCTDGKDNDLDDKVDCADPDCAAANNCKCLTMKCDDGKVCTADSCDPKTAKCVYVPNSAPCDDGNGCTTGDTCGDGNCLGAAKDCGDGDPCTADSCDKGTGKCKNTAIAGCGGCKSGADCDDGNACTDDACDVDAGKCKTTNNKAPCDSGDLCTWGDVCDGKGSCVAGKNQSCDDGNDCTNDKCEAKTGECLYGNTANGSKCSDGKACTTGDACKAGKCTPTKADCPLYSESFDCPWNNGAKGWTLEVSSGTNGIRWAIDNTPKVTKDGKGCNLNYNDGTDYCTPWFGSNCRTPNQSAYTPVLDASKVQGTPRLKFTTWYDLDAGNNTDLPRVYVYGGSSVIHTFTLDKAKMKQWRDLDLPIPNIKGRNNVRIRFTLNPASGQGGNKGQGWFIDDLVITNPGSSEVPAEICDNGKDDNSNGKIDCLDVDCKGKPACDENCSDGKDNDFDDKVDCADPDCSGDAVCQPPLVSAPMDCGDKGFAYSKAKNGVTFAIDGTPNTVKPQTGKCTMNFNNGKNFCGIASCSQSSNNNRSAGTATWDKIIDATTAKTITAEFWSFQWGQNPSGSGAYRDIGMLQASTNDFAGCCNGNAVCNSWSSEYCNNNNTKSFIADKSVGAWKKWVKVKVNLGAFAGKKFKLRYRFTSRNSEANNLPGWFVDDLKVFAGK